MYLHHSTRRCSYQSVPLALLVTSHLLLYSPFVTVHCQAIFLNSHTHHRRYKNPMETALFPLVAAVVIVVVVVGGGGGVVADVVTYYNEIRALN